MASRRLSLKQIDFINCLLGHETFLLDEDASIALVIGKIVRDHLVDHLDIIEKVIAHNPELVRKSWLNPNKFYRGGTYLYNCYTMAEVALEYFNANSDSLIQKFESVCIKERVRAAQIIYCLSCAKDQRHRDWFKEIADRRIDPFIVNNTIYALAYLDNKDDFPYILGFISGPYMLPFSGPYYMAPLHVAAQWSNTQVAREILQNVLLKYQGRFNYRSLCDILIRILDLSEDERLTGANIPILGNRLPPGLTTPYAPYSMELR